MLWYLHLCADEGIIVTDYMDAAEGIMIENVSGSGEFEKVILKPIVTVAESEMAEKAYLLHTKAIECCFIANSVNFKIIHEPVIQTS